MSRTRSVGSTPSRPTAHTLRWRFDDRSAISHPASQPANPRGCLNWDRIASASFCFLFMTTVNSRLRAFRPWCLTVRTQHYTHLGDRAQCSSSCYNTLSLTLERSVAMSDWVEAELAECQRHDVRHTKRLARLLGRLSEQPVGSIPMACHGWAETMAAYRFLHNPAIGVQEILSGHTHATRQRIRAQEVVLLVQDTTFLNYGTTRPKAGMGTVKIKTREEYLLHLTVAFTPERVNLGVVGMKVWQRPEEPVAQQRKSKPIEEKESYRWLEGYRGACEIKQACPATLVVNMADREGDIQDWLVDAMRRKPDQRAEVIIRAKCNRRLAPGATQRYLWAEMQQTPSLGTLTLALARQPDRPPRQVILAVTATQVTFHGARRPGGKLPPVEVSAVYAQEPSPPPGETPVEWLLLTSLP